MIGFDLDGIFVSDIIVDWDKSLEKGMDIRKHMKPIFIPNFKKYYIITGRPIKEKDYTLEWVSKQFKTNPPLEILVNDSSNPEDGTSFKAKCIKEKNISLYFESSDYQCEILERMCPKTIIIPFHKFINKSLNEKSKVIL